MKTTDLIFQNQKVLNALQEMLLQTKKHVEFLAANAPEIREIFEIIFVFMISVVGILVNDFFYYFLHKLYFLLLNHHEYLNNNRF